MIKLRFYLFFSAFQVLFNWAKMEWKIMRTKVPEVKVAS